MAIFVDSGFIIATTNNELVDILMRHLKDDLETKENKLDQFFEVKIYQKPDDSICIHQTTYCKSILKKFNMEEFKVVPHSCRPTAFIKYSLSQTLQVGEIPYREAVESPFQAKLQDQI